MSDLVIESNWEWGSHKSVVHAMMDYFKVQFVLELGIGINSTPAFLRYTPEMYIGIDNDESWINYIKNLYTFDPKYSVIFHDLGEFVNIGTKLKELNEEKVIEITNYYSELRQRVLGNSIQPKLLFVDHFTCGRKLAIQTLADVFDIVLYHDCQELGIQIYDYQFTPELLDLFNIYVLKVKTSWTGCWIKKALVYDETSISTHIIKYCAENNIAYDLVNFEKV